MPRKKIDGSGSVTKTKLQFATILAFFSVSSLEIADFALDLVTDAVKQRHAKGKAVLAGRAKGASATEAVDAATKSALPFSAVKERKKPGPAKGSKRKAAGSGVGETPGAGNATAGEEVTDAAALPVQEGTLDLG